MPAINLIWPPPRVTTPFTTLTLANCSPTQRQTRRLPSAWCGETRPSMQNTFLQSARCKVLSPHPGTTVEHTDELSWNHFDQLVLETQMTLQTNCCISCPAGCSQANYAGEEVGCGAPGLSSLHLWSLTQSDVMPNSLKKSNWRWCEIEQQLWWWFLQSSRTNIPQNICGVVDKTVNFFMKESVTLSSQFFLFMYVFFLFMYFVGWPIFCLRHPPERPSDAGRHPQAPERGEEDRCVGHAQTAVSTTCRLGVYVCVRVCSPELLAAIISIDSQS